MKTCEETRYVDRNGVVWAHGIPGPSAFRSILPGRDLVRMILNMNGHRT